jgi:hypothetical protein
LLLLDLVITRELVVDLSLPELAMLTDLAIPMLIELAMLVELRALPL